MEMLSVELKIKKLPNCKALPEYQTDGAAGMDLSAGINEAICLGPMQRELIPAGIIIELPKGFEAQVRPRSGLSIKHGITLVNCVGTIDEDYRGEICVGLINLSDKDYIIQPGERIAQMIVSPITKVRVSVVNTLSELSETTRCSGGFGSTG